MKHLQNYFLLNVLGILFLCTVVKPTDHSDHSVKRVQRLAKLPAVKLQGELIPRGKFNSTRPDIHAKRTQSTKAIPEVTPVPASEKNASSNSNKTKNLTPHLPKTNSNPLKIRNSRFGTISKGIPGVRTTTATTSTQSIELSQEITTDIPIVTTEASKENTAGIKRGPFTIISRPELKNKAPSLSIRGRPIDEKKMQFKKLLVDSSSTAGRKLNINAKTSTLTTASSESSSNISTNDIQDTTMHYETTTDIPSTTDTKRPNVTNHSHERVKPFRVTHPPLLDKKTVTVRTPAKHSTAKTNSSIPSHDISTTAKTNSSIASHDISTTEKTTPKLRTSTHPTRNRETIRKQGRTKLLPLESVRISSINKHVPVTTATPSEIVTKKNKENETKEIEEVNKTTVDTTVVPQVTTEATRKRYSSRKRGKPMNNADQYILNKTIHDLTISESDLKQTYKTPPKENDSRDHKENNDKNNSLNFSIRKTNESAETSTNRKIKTTTDSDIVSQTTELSLTETTEQTTNNETEMPGVEVTTSRIEKMSTRQESRTTEKYVTSTTSPKITTTTQIPHDSNEQLADKNPHRSRGGGRRGRVVKVVRVVPTQPLVTTTSETTPEITTYPTTVMEYTTSTVNDTVSVTAPDNSTSRNSAKRKQRLTSASVNDAQAISAGTKDTSEVTLLSALNSSVWEGQNFTEIKHRNGNRRSHRVVKTIRRTSKDNSSRGRHNNEEHMDEDEKGIILTGTLNFDAPRRVKKVIKITRMNTPETSSAKPPTTSEATPESGSITTTTGITADSLEYMSTLMQERKLEPEEKSALPTISKSGEEVTLINDIFETTTNSIIVTETQKENVVSTTKKSEKEVVVNNYTQRSRGRTHRRRVYEDVQSTSSSTEITTETLLDTPAVNTTDLDYDEIYDDHDEYVGSSSRQVERVVFVLPEKPKSHEQIHKRAADDSVFDRPTENSTITDPTRSQRFVSGSETSKSSRRSTNQVYQRRSEYRIAANKYRNKYQKKAQTSNRNSFKSSSTSPKVKVINSQKDELSAQNENISVPSLEEVTNVFSQTTVQTATLIPDLYTTQKQKIFNRTSRFESTLNSSTPTIPTTEVNLPPQELIEDILIPISPDSAQPPTLSRKIQSSSTVIKFSESPNTSIENRPSTISGSTRPYIILTARDLVIPSSEYNVDISAGQESTVPLENTEKDRVTQISRKITPPLVELSQSLTPPRNNKPITRATIASLSGLKKTPVPNIQIEDRAPKNRDQRKTDINDKEQTLLFSDVQTNSKKGNPTESSLITSSKNVKTAVRSATNSLDGIKRTTVTKVDIGDEDYKNREQRKTYNNEKDKIFLVQDQNTSRKIATYTESSLATSSNINNVAVKLATNSLYVAKEKSAIKVSEVDGTLSSLYEKKSNFEKTYQDTEKSPSFTEALTNRAYKVLAAVQQMAGAVMEIPKQILLLPVRFGFLPGLERTQDQIPKSVEFPCRPQRSQGSEATSVHRLRPEDIAVVAAMGDSYTTANAAMANNEEESKNNYRGVSAMGGGQGTWRQYLTIPNILKEFNPELLGYSLGIGDVASNNPLSGLNVAEIGKRDDQILQQAQILVAKIRNSNLIDFNNDWKLVNLLIGANDICSEYCYHYDDKDSPIGHWRQLEETLLYLKENLPRTFVNLIQLPNMLYIQNMKNTPFLCHMKQVEICSCLFGASENLKGESVAKMLQGYWAAERRVANDEQFDSEDFAVVLQPALMGVGNPETLSTVFGEVTDLSYYAPDCVHFSQKGLAQVANALWNNMLEPVGNKSLGWAPPLEKFRCPSENAPYLFTKRNSRTFYKTGHQ